MAAATAAAAAAPVAPDVLAINERLEPARLERRFETIGERHVLPRIGDENPGLRLRIRRLFRTFYHRHPVARDTVPAAEQVGNAPNRQQMSASGQKAKNSTRANLGCIAPDSDRCADIQDRQLRAVSTPSGRGQDGTIRACTSPGEYASFQSETTG